MTYEEWQIKLKKLDEHIKSLKNWDDYALSCQNEYDWLLKQEPTKEIPMNDSPKDIARYYEAGVLGSFSTSLMDLFGKADIENKRRLSVAFPEYAEAYRIWFKGEYKNENNQSDS